MKAARVAPLALLALLAACASAPFRPTEPAPTRPATAASLAGGLWTAGKGTFRIRQSVLIEYLGARVAFTGVMRLDTGARTARLVGMDEMGIKWFDFSVDPAETRTNFLLPALGRHPRLTGAVGDSVRRIFLDPEPGEADRLQVEADRYVLEGTRGENAVRFVFGGEDAQLLEKRCRGPAGRYRVRYYEHRRLHGLSIPWGIVADDHRGGYRVTLWTESVEPVDE